MNRTIGKTRQRKIMLDMLTAQYDLSALAQRYCLDEIDLANWALNAANHRRLIGLCVLADVQTQLMISRYRSLAANRLIALASSETVDPDLARKACVDLLKIELKRADLEPAKQDAEQGDDPFSAMRHFIYGQVTTPAPSPRSGGEGWGEGA